MNGTTPSPMYQEPKRWEMPLALLLVAGLFGGCVTKCAMDPCGDYTKYEQTIQEHGAPLVAAIQQYVAENGSPPDSLEALVPKYIAAIPSSGYPGQPRFEYMHVYEYSWKISVDCSCWWERFGSTYDDIYYLSGENHWYPKPK